MTLLIPVPTSTSFRAPPQVKAGQVPLKNAEESDTTRWLFTQEEIALNAGLCKAEVCETLPSARASLTSLPVSPPHRRLPPKSWRALHRGPPRLLPPRGHRARGAQAQAPRARRRQPPDARPRPPRTSRPSRPATARAPTAASNTPRTLPRLNIVNSRPIHAAAALPPAPAPRGTKGPRAVNTAALPLPPRPLPPANTSMLRSFAYARPMIPPRLHQGKG